MDLDMLGLSTPIRSSSSTAASSASSSSSLNQSDKENKSAVDVNSINTNSDGNSNSSNNEDENRDGAETGGSSSSGRAAPSDTGDRMLASIHFSSDDDDSPAAGGGGQTPLTGTVAWICACLLTSMCIYFKHMCIHKYAHAYIRIYEHLNICRRGDTRRLRRVEIEIEKVCAGASEEKEKVRAHAIHPPIYIHTHTRIV